MHRKYRREFALSIVLIVTLLIALAGVVLIIRNRENKANDTKDNNSTQTQLPSDVSSSDQSMTDNQVNQSNKPDFDSVALQQAVTNWVDGLSSSSDASVVITDENGKVLAESNPDEVYFTASLYKLFVAYEGYRLLGEGKYSDDQNYLYSYSRLGCLDAMIRSSYSPCGEKLWNELGKQTLTDTMGTYGISDTTLVGLSTTASDTAKILQRIYKSTQLTDEFRQKYLDSMLNQDAVYRRGLPSGFSEGVKVYNKVGWNEQVEWHDGSIIEFPDGKVLIVAVLTKNVGYKNIANLGSSIETAVNSYSE